MVALESRSEGQDSVDAIETKTGQLIIIGGGEDKEGDCQVLREFIRRAGGRDARIVVMTVATSIPGEVGSEYRSLFERLGADIVNIVDTVYREDASYSRNLEIIKDATGVFFTGGDQARITEILKDSEIHNLLHQKFDRGLVIGGTSAGAAMMPIL